MENIVPSICLNHKNDNVTKDTYIEKYYQEKKLDERIIELEKELQYTKECLQASIEDAECSREELKSETNLFLN